MPEHIEGHQRPSTGRGPTEWVTEDGARRVVVSSWVDLETAELIDAIAEAKGVTKSTLVREAIQSLALKQSLRDPEGGRKPRRGSSTRPGPRRAPSAA
jgi:hypothetical protein